MTITCKIHHAETGRHWHVEFDGEFIVTNSTDPLRTTFDIEGVAPWSVVFDDRKGWKRRRYRPYREGVKSAARQANSMFGAPTYPEEAARRMGPLLPTGQRGGGPPSRPQKISQGTTGVSHLP